MRVFGLISFCSALCAVFTLLILKYTGLAMHYSILIAVVFSVLVFLMFDLKSASGHRPGDSVIMKISKHIKTKGR